MNYNEEWVQYRYCYYYTQDHTHYIYSFCLPPKISLDPPQIQPPATTQDLDLITSKSTEPDTYPSFIKQKEIIVTAQAMHSKGTVHTT